MIKRWKDGWKEGRENRRWDGRKEGRYCTRTLKIVYVRTALFFHN